MENNTSHAIATILLVDDEPSVLSSLKRLLRPFGYRVFSAESGAAGLEVMSREPVDLVISDMRMPEMNGAQFLEHCQKNYPGAMRILLTGYSDMESTIDAINNGKLHRYMSKPWEDHDITTTVRQALELRSLELERARLEKLTKEQNEALEALNSNLASQVLERTEALRQSMASLEIAHKKLNEGFIASIRTLSNLIEMRGGALSGMSKQVSDDARRVAQKIGMDAGDIQDVTFAALLKDLGKVGLPDRLLTKPFSALDISETSMVMRHPVQGQAALMSLERLDESGRIIRHQNEHFNGKGFPDHLEGDEIPMGARILAVVGDYAAAQCGLIQPIHLSPSGAASYLLEHKGTRYDPAVVDVFLSLLNTFQESIGFPVSVDLLMDTDQIKPGMIIARDLMAEGGALLLARGYVLDEKKIGLLQGYEQTMGTRFALHIKPPGDQHK